MAWLALLGALIWTVVFILPWRPWSTKERLDSNDKDRDLDLSDLTILIPARNEESEISSTLRSIKDQSEDVNVILVNDQSTDRTKEVAESIKMKNLRIIDGVPLQDGWAGKLWALEQGRKEVKTPFVLLMDADIQLKPGILKTLLAKLKAENLGYVSLMAALKMETFWEKLLIPAYIYFFKLLYPFAISNSKSRLIGVAAGGCNLVRTEILEQIGGFASLKEAFIDDCSLATLIKSYGHRSFTGLTHSVTSHRSYSELKEIWNLIARFAYTYLKYSPALLLLCSLLMISAFIALPLGAFFFNEPLYQTFCVLGLLCMFVCYLPTIRFYRLNPLWCISLPLSGFLYLSMTWSSALRYHRGQRTSWKGRVYRHDLQSTSETEDKAA